MKDLLFVDRKHHEAKSQAILEARIDKLPTTMTRRSSEDLVIYVHVPFCYQKCTYCFFSTVTKYTEDDLDGYVKMLVHEIQQKADCIKGSHVVRSVYFGGGTPLNLGVERLERVFHQITKFFSISDATEISIELDPATTKPIDLIKLQEIGFGRFSFGIQFFDEEFLRKSGRKPAKNFDHLLKTVKSNSLVNFDLLLGFPTYSPNVFLTSLDLALGYKPSVITIYPLAIKQGSTVYIQMARGSFVPPDWQEINNFLNEVGTILGANGYQQRTLWSFVSNSNFSHCLYEELSWHGCDSLGLGAGAISHYGNLNFRNTPLKAEAAQIGYRLECGLKIDDAQKLSQLLVSGLRMKNLDMSVVERFQNVSPNRIVRKLNSLGISGYFEIEDNIIKWISPSVIDFKENICASIMRSHEGEAFASDFWYVP